MSLSQFGLQRRDLAPEPVDIERQAVQLSLEGIRVDLRRRMLAASGDRLLHRQHPNHDSSVKTRTSSTNSASRVGSSWRMDARHWFLRAGDVSMDVNVRKDASAEVRVRSSQAEKQLPPSLPEMYGLSTVPSPSRGSSDAGDLSEKSESCDDSLAPVPLPSSEELDCALTILKDGAAKALSTPDGAEQSARLARVFDWLEALRSDALPTRG